MRACEVCGHDRDAGAVLRFIELTDPRDYSVERRLLCTPCRREAGVIEPRGRPDSAMSVGAAMLRKRTA